MLLRIISIDTPYGDADVQRLNEGIIAQKTSD